MALLEGVVKYNHSNKTILNMMMTQTKKLTWSAGGRTGQDLSKILGPSFTVFLPHVLTSFMVHLAYLLAQKYLVAYVLVYVLVYFLEFVSLHSSRTCFSNPSPTSQVDPRRRRWTSAKPRGSDTNLQTPMRQSQHVCHGNICSVSCKCYRLL